MRATWDYPIAWVLYYEFELRLEWGSIGFINVEYPSNLSTWKSKDIDMQLIYYWTTNCCLETGPIIRLICPSTYSDLEEQWMRKTVHTQPDKIRPSLRILSPNASNFTMNDSLYWWYIFEIKMLCFSIISIPHPTSWLKYYIKNYVNMTFAKELKY